MALPRLATATVLATGLVLAGASPALASPADSVPTAVALAGHHHDGGDDCTNPNFCAGEGDSRHEKIKKFKHDLRKAIKDAIKKHREHHGGGGGGGGGCSPFC